ncbi:uncharacterized protein [Montipora foliosa]|uniref:uncharacterized protein n=1 Tax=Montipora foliosa TaxID=591990 RepID=UPI0035F10A8D
MSFGRGIGKSSNQNDGGRPSKFLYSGKNNKSNPWNTSVDDHGDDLNHSLQPINKFTKTKDSPNPPGSQLDDVWSIRKNVQVSQASKKGTVLNGSKSTSTYYSRHGGLSGSSEIENSLAQKGRNDGFSNSDDDHKSWSIARSSNFSYSNKEKFSPGNNETLMRNQPDDFLDNELSPKGDENDMVYKKNLLNSKLRMAGAPQIANREMSARTRRAKKMHDAHLRSMGLGQFTPTSNSSYNSPNAEKDDNSYDDF